MKHLLNILYITLPEAYLLLEGETVLVRKADKSAGKMVTALRLPLHNLEAIVCFNYQGVSPALMGACAERKIDLCFLSPGGRFLARVVGGVKGNVLLRKKQSQVSEDAAQSHTIARSFLIGKIANSRKVIERALRDHAMLVDTRALGQASAALRETLLRIRDARLPNADQPGRAAIDDLMGQEGSASLPSWGRGLK